MTRRLHIDSPGGKATGVMPDGPGEDDLEPEPFERDVERRDPAELLLGKVLVGRYRVTRVLGRGGVGVVFEGTHIELGRRVAIKVLQAGYARDSEALERFEREARTASKIGHPNIVTVLDLGRLETGEPFFVMEHLEGNDLEEEMSTAGMRAVPPVARALELLRAISGALDTLHGEGIVHRDVKPANVFLAKSTGGLERIKLVDFGLATLADAERRGERLTREGFIVGTAEYMAPECARGALGGPAADVYSLAVMAFELLSGTLPFNGAPLDVVIEKVREPAPPLSSVTRRYPAEVDLVIGRALERDPRRRHASCAAFVAELAEALSRPMPAHRPEPGSSGDTDRLPRTNDRRWIAGALGLTLVLVASGIGLTSLGGTAPPAAPPSAPDLGPRAPELALSDGLVVPEGEASPVEPPLPEVTGAPDPTHHAPIRSARDRSHPLSPGAPTRLAVPEPGPVATPEPTPEVEAAPPEPETRPEVDDAAPISAEPGASPSDLVRQAQAALMHGEAARARDLFRDATRVGPRHAPAWRGLGVTSEQLREHAEARRAFERYLEIAPDAPDAATIRGRLESLGN